MLSTCIRDVHRSTLSGAIPTIFCGFVVQKVALAEGFLRVLFLPLFSKNPPTITFHGFLQALSTSILLRHFPSKFSPTNHPIIMLPPTVYGLNSRQRCKINHNHNHQHISTVFGFGTDTASYPIPTEGLFQVD
jgi:hypothetical protein